MEGDKGGREGGKEGQMEVREGGKREGGMGGKFCILVCTQYAHVPRHFE